MVLASCSRRAGKSYGCAWKLIQTGERFGHCTMVYIVQARETAKDIIWAPLQELNRKYDLNLKFNQNTGEVKSPTGWRIILRGVGSRREIEKLRGQKYPLVIIDEAQVFGPDLRYLLRDVIQPATLDYGDDAQIYMIGTPNAARAGPFYDFITSEKYPHYHWTVLENPHVPDPAGFLDRMRGEFGGETPTFLREYRGQWVRDAEGLVFKIDDRLNVRREFPEAEADDWVYVLGVDLGWRATAFVVLAYSRDTERCLVVAAEEHAKINTSRIAALVQQYQEDWDIAQVVVDAGGFGRTMTEDLRTTYGIAAEFAKKRDKAATIERMNADLQAGTMQLCSMGTSNMLDQVKILPWDSEKLQQNKLDFDDKFEDHMPDAWIYAYRFCHHHNEDWLEHPAKYGSTDYWNEWEEAQIQKRVEKYCQGPDPDYWMFDD